MNGCDNSTEKKLEHLIQILLSMESVAVAYSGGVDSTFLLKVAHDHLKNNVVATIVESVLSPLEELKEAIDFLEKRGIKYTKLRVDILSNKMFRLNPPDRCYHCKMDIFKKIRDFASSKNISHIIEGSNYDDESDYRPGKIALTSLSIKSPLLEAGLTKSEIRMLSKEKGLPSWNKPAQSCMATRIPFGTEITKEMLEKIKTAENYLKKIGIDNVRVRCHGEIARIELPKEKRSILLEKSLSEKIIKKFKSLGFTYITLDIEGYRMGSMNEMINKESINGQG